ncbi:Hypothetical predicted protein [Octopus vulgaris]|uniref:Uncharacterized protein n=1 Tax=Octopus vulgaris TaxID=6645 RepID=A0AA36BT38_OCTVU|nr:Hypothetical predicted protein [Octopus vulgaris]
MWKYLRVKTISDGDSVQVLSKVFEKIFEKVFHLPHTSYDHRRKQKIHRTCDLQETTVKYHFRSPVISLKLGKKKH